MEKQEYFMRMNMLGQEAEKLEQHMQAIDQQMQELNGVKSSIESINNNEQKEILSNLGKGIFIETEIKNRELFVNIGGGIIVKKTADETIKIIKEQSEKLLLGKEEITLRIEELQDEMKKLLGEAQAEQGNGCDDDCTCENHDCECENDCDCKHGEKCGQDCDCDDECKNKHKH